MSNVSVAPRQTCARPLCAEEEWRINGYCSVYCEDVDELQQEVDRLKRIIAYEARVAEAHYEGRKGYSKARRPLAEAQVERMRALAMGDGDGYDDWTLQREWKALERDRRP